MGQITLQIPQSGQFFSTEGPKVATDMTVLQTVINGNLDSTNLSSSAAIALSQMVPGVLGLTSAVGVTANGTLAANALSEVNTNVTTQTLPSPTVGRLVGVLLGTAASVTVATSGAPKIVGVGSFTVASIQMGVSGQVVLFYGDGTNWVIVSGQQDTGWVGLTLTGTGTAQLAGTRTVAYRLIGDRVFLRGSVSFTATTTITIFTLPAGARPVSNGAAFGVLAPNMLSAAVTTGGAMLLQGTASMTNAYLDGVNFDLS